MHERIGFIVSNEVKKVMISILWKEKCFSNKILAIKILFQMFPKHPQKLIII